MRRDVKPAEYVNPAKNQEKWPELMTAEKNHVGSLKSIERDVAVSFGLMPLTVEPNSVHMLEMMIVPLLLIF